MGNFKNDFKYGQKIIDECEAAGFYKKYYKEVQQVTNKDIQLKYDIDLVAWTEDGMHYIEQKSIRNRASMYNDKDGFYTNICIETWSCPRKKTKGWIYKSKATTLIYFLTQPSGKQRAYFINMRGLQNWWKEQDYHRYEKHEEKNENRTECRLVPFKEIKQYIENIVDLENYKEIV